VNVGVVIKNGVLIAPSPVTRHEFTGVVKSLLPRYPGIQAFGWNPLVKDDERDIFESAARKEGFDDFEFTERSETKKLVRAARREEYVVVYCAMCKQIRDDRGSWNQIEDFIRERSEADFSHGLCPKCAKKLYPDLYDEKHENA